MLPNQPTYMESTYLHLCEYIHRIYIGTDFVTLHEHHKFHTENSKIDDNVKTTLNAQPNGSH